MKPGPTFLLSLAAGLAILISGAAARAGPVKSVSVVVTVQFVPSSGACGVVGGGAGAVGVTCGVVPGAPDPSPSVPVSPAPPGQDLVPADTGGSVVVIPPPATSDPSPLPQPGGGGVGSPLPTTLTPQFVRFGGQYRLVGSLLVDPTDAGRLAIYSGGVEISGWRLISFADNGRYVELTISW